MSYETLYIRFVGGPVHNQFIESIRSPYDGTLLPVFKIPVYPERKPFWQYKTVEKQTIKIAIYKIQCYRFGSAIGLEYVYRDGEVPNKDDDMASEILGFEVDRGPLRRLEFEEMCRQLKI